MKRKLSVSDFAALVGTTPKTIYERIKKNGELPLNEQLETVNEKVKGREVVLISTDTEQIETYKNIYGKDNVIDGEYYEIVTDNNGLNLDNNSYKQVKTNNNSALSGDIIDRLLTLNNDYNHRIDTVRNELLTTQKQLMESEKKMLFLEDKANREGLYLKEIDDLKKESNGKSNLIKLLITVIIILLMVIITSLTVFITINNIQKPLQNDSVTAEIDNFLKQ